jgi:hypothetical protein
MLNAQVTVLPLQQLLGKHASRIGFGICLVSTREQPASER